SRLKAPVPQPCCDGKPSPKNESTPAWANPACPCDVSPPESVGTASLPVGGVARTAKPQSGICFPSQVLVPWSSTEIGGPCSSPDTTLGWAKAAHRRSSGPPQTRIAVIRGNLSPDHRHRRGGGARAPANDMAHRGRCRPRRAAWLIVEAAAAAGLTPSSVMVALGVALSNDAAVATAGRPAG